MFLPLVKKYRRDYWCPDDLNSQEGIAVKEAKALFQTLTTFSEEVFNGRMDAFVDNSNLIDFWNNKGGRNTPLTNEIKDLFHLSLKLNIVLNLFYILSESNDAESPSRVYSDLDCSLTVSIWYLLQSTFSPHTVDMMALLSNVMKAQNEYNVKFCSPLPFNEPSGINVFAQDLSSQENYCVFPHLS